MAKRTAKKSETEKNTQSESKPKSNKSLIGEEVKIKSNGAEYFGKVVSERKTNSGSQVFLQLNGIVSRWFNVDDLKNEES